ncbi:MAG: hypothetical protein IPJ39_14320 [Saprospiraceae bacterium]|nr:hypothetical protein [Saprospiraceae bacterium]
MKSFFSTFFASCLGVFAALIIGVLILVGIGMAGMARDNSYSENSILKLQLEDFIPEKSDNVNIGPGSVLETAPDAIGLMRILNLLDAASKDSKIKGILIENNHVSVGQATV